MRYLIAICSTILLAGAPLASAQSILVDQGGRFEGLWCFPMSDNPRHWVYVPDRARLSADEQGRPQFSFVRYVVNEPTATGPSAQAITTAGGGGILHFLVQYDTDPAKVEAAEKALREKLKDKEIALRGPIVFDSGQYALVSSILTKEGKTKRTLVASGRAPVLEGQRLALSFDLEPTQATLLLENLKSNTPDVSIVFDMTFGGLRNAYDAELTVDWTEVHNAMDFSAGGTVYFVSADVEYKVDELFRKNCIKLRTSGADAANEALLASVYAKIIDLLFSPVPSDKIPPESRGGIADALGQLMSGRNTGKMVGFGVHVGFRMKQFRSSGRSVMNFNHQALVERHSFITFNIGDFHKKFGADPGHFRDVNLSDPAYRQREIQVAVDGALLPDFDKYINSVTVTLRKKHGSGQETLREVVIDRNTFKDTSTQVIPKMVYGNDRDADTTAWLKYDYRTRWSFKGGGTHQTDWKEADAAMIDLFTPYERKVVTLVGDTKSLKDAGARAVVVEVEYPFFTEKRRAMMVVRTDKPEQEHTAELTLPLGSPEYGYTITWQMNAGKRLTSKGKDGSGILYIDELPKE